MRLLCGPPSFESTDVEDMLRVVLYGQAGSSKRASAGASARTIIRRRKFDPAPRAWDFLSIALSLMTADGAGLRDGSADGWTREFELEIAVADPHFWNSQAQALSEALAFLSTDRWSLRFVEGGFLPAPAANPVRPKEDSVVLLSGGLHSLVGAIDIVGSGKRPLAISKTVRGDGEKQIAFAAAIGGGLNHVQLNDNANAPGKGDSSQRARSVIFISFGVLVATGLARYQAGETVPLFVCENGFIAINPPLTGSRLGSLSTRTAHPEYLARLQTILDAAGLRVQITNPYAAKTKGEMLKECVDQALLKSLAATSTSCGRFQRYNYHHCGRCVPCQVRRASFLAWGVSDPMEYKFDELGRDDADHAGFDDVRSVGIACAAISADGFDAWLGNALGLPHVVDRGMLKAMLQRGLGELGSLHAKYGVK